MNDLHRALKKGKKTSPGNDMLSYDMFRHLNDEAKHIVLKFFNLVWSSGSVPKCWKHAIIVPILKPKIIKTDPKSYRPIALTSNF